jgi:hypothetical protein
MGEEEEATLDTELIVCTAPERGTLDDCIDDEEGTLEEEMFEFNFFRFNFLH